MLELYLNSRPRRENSSSIKLTWIPSNSQRITQALQTTDPCKLGRNASRQILVWEIVNIEPQFGMTFAPYYYGESKPCDDEDECHIDKFEVEEEDGEERENKDDGDAKLVKPVN